VSALRLAILIAAIARPVTAHPAPFSYVDVRIDGHVIHATVVAHVFDLGHDLGISPPEQLLDRAVLAAEGPAINELIERRLNILVDGQRLAAASSEPAEALTERQSIKLQFVYDVGHRPGAVVLAAIMFPYDVTHQTFVNIYDGEALATQAIVDAESSRFEYFSGTIRGTGAAGVRFLWAGFRHILGGPDHLVFLTGLLLLGGSTRRFVLIVTAFTLAHFGALALETFRVVTPSDRILEPAVALSIVYLGADNLLVHEGHDVRAWIALAFGFIHGFSVAGAIRAVGLSTNALISTLISFNAGLEIAQVLFVVLVASLLSTLRSRSAWASRQITVAGSVVVIAAGAFWFVQRVFFL
jgi:HupE / UreJ protein